MGHKVTSMADYVITPGSRLELEVSLEILKISWILIDDPGKLL
jgi:hypothetical protein